MDDRTNMFRVAARLLALLLVAASAAPAHAQSSAEPRPAEAAVPVLAYQWPSPVPTAAPSANPSVSVDDPVLTRLPSRVEPLHAVDSRRMSVGGYTAVGAVVGALLGTAALYLGYDCTETGSMCGLGIPLFAGGGALVGGLVGFVTGKVGS
jgi:hypothetical protein